MQKKKKKKNAIKCKRIKKTKDLILYSGMLMMFCQLIIQTHSRMRERQKIIQTTYVSFRDM